jgi:hypothetical protein
VKATRISEGVETDWYLCEKGHRSGADWAHGGPPSEPQWPPSAELISQVAKIAQAKK